MGVCPNCGNQPEEKADVCSKCGNPLGKERPWEKKTSLAGNAADVASGRKPKIRHQNRQVSKQARYDATQQQEYYLNDEFVIAVGYCGFSASPEAPEELREGTAVLTKNYLLFGKSEHAIRCGNFKLEIPVELLRCVTDTQYRGKAALLIKTRSGEQLIMYTVKREEWIDYFKMVTEYIPAEIDLAAEKKEERASMSFLERWGRAFLYFIGVIVSGFIYFRAEGIVQYAFFVVGICCIFLIGVAVFAPERLSRK